MIISRLNGGLGNQMFQYAFAKMLCEKYAQDLYIDTSQFKNSNRSYGLDIFNFDQAFWDFDSEIAEGKVIIEIREDRFEFDEIAVSALENHNLNQSIFLITGYWQSHKYFSHISSLIRREFRMSFQIDNTYFEIQNLIRSTESVMIHIRRGDYLWNENLAKHGVVDVSYLERSMTYFNEVLPEVLFLVFSDDPSWCIENIPPAKNLIFIKKDLDQGRTSFNLMRQCKHFIISNSTFSWWAAWLGNNPEKRVICPNKWFQNDINTSDLIPSEWVRY
jgi:hypothetical protein